MYMTLYRSLIFVALCAGLIGGPTVGLTYTGEELANDAKITLADARAIALKTFPGKIKGEELEKEKGGSGLRYSFDIEKGRVIHEVGIDAETGSVLENSVEGAQAD
jgi:uncharacterized membrane protein YkoI